MKKLFVSTAFLLAAGAGLASAADGLAPDIVYYNGKIVTVNAAFAVVEAVAVKEGKVLSVGTTDAMKKMAAPDTQMIDLRGKTVLPGFYEGHAHIGGFDDDGGKPEPNDWRKLNTREALYSAIGEQVKALPKGAWILGSLKNENFPQERLPNRWDLDKVAPENPVVLERGHITVANSMAMEKDGITRDTTIAAGGSIDKDEKGEPIGWFREGAGKRLAMKAVPPAPAPPADIIQGRIRTQLQHLLSFGITSVNIPGMRPGGLKYLQNTYAKWAEELPRSTVQLRVYPGYDSYDDAAEGAEATVREIEGLSFHTGFGDDRLKLGSIKMSIDGGFSAAAFWSLVPYPNRPDYTGLQRIPDTTFYRVARRAHDLGWQLGVHAIGDAAVKMVVDTYERILKESPRADHRHYIHHFSVMPPEETLQKVAANDILVCSQPNFTYSLGPYNASPGLSPERLQSNNPQKTLLKHGIHLAYGSDGMPLGPLVGIYAAVTRRGVDGKVYGPEEKLTVAEAIKAYTMGTSYMTFDEKTRGSLEPGKVADMVVLGQDILTIDPERIKDIPIEQTIVAGQVLFSAQKVSPTSAQ